MTLVIVGAGLAGLRTAESARESGYAGRVVVLGDEVHLPYDRPPLSKQVLTGEWAEDSLFLTDETRLSAAGIELRTGAAVSSADHRAVTLADGSTVPYERLVVATGAEPRRLPGLGVGERVHHLRSLEDARGLTHALRSGEDLLVIGAGFVGLEVAAAARARGVAVTVVESSVAPLVASLGLTVGSWLARLHRDQGVRVLTGTSLASIAVSADGVRADLASGERLVAGHVVVGVGASPRTVWLAGLGLDHPGGVPCDAGGRAADRIWAAGDAAAWADPIHGDRPWTGHWTAAGSQAAIVGAAVAGREVNRPAEPPYFWSKQYDVNIQVAGRPDLADAVAVLERGEAGGRGDVFGYTARGRLVAVAALGSPRRFLVHRRELEPVLAS